MNIHPKSTSLKTLTLAAAIGVALGTVMVSTSPAQAKNEAAKSDANVAARVNGLAIFKDELSKNLKNVPPQLLAGIPQESLQTFMLDNMINELLLAEEAKKQKIIESKTYKERLETIQGTLVKQLLVEKIVNDNVSDAKVKAEYEKFKKENTGKKEVRARHILLSTEVEAQKAISDLDSGKDFAELAKERSSGPSAGAGGDLGYFVKEDMVPEFAEAAFALRAGEYTKTPVKTQFGFHVIKVEDKRVRALPGYDDVAPAIRSKLSQDALENAVTKLRKQATIEYTDGFAPKTDAPETKKN